MNPSPSDKPPEPDRISRARQKRAERRLSELHPDKSHELLAELSKKHSLAVRPMLAAVLSGLLFAIGLRRQETILIVFAVYIAPWMGSLTGLALATILGEARYWLQFLAKFLLVMLLVMIGAGIAVSFGPSIEENTALITNYSRLNIVEFAFVIGGAAYMMLNYARSGKIHTLGRLAIAHGVLQPLSAFSMGILRTNQDLWQGALSTVALHLTWGVATGLVVMIVLGYMPQRRGAGTFLVGLLLIGVIGLSSSLSLGGSILMALPAPTPLPIIVPTFTATPVPPTTTAITPSATPSPPPSATHSPMPSATPTQTFGVVLGTGGFGVMLREAPNGNPIRGLFEGVEVEIIGGPLLIEDETWWQVRTSNDVEGWVLSSFIVTVTPEGSENP